MRVQNKLLFLALLTLSIHHGYAANLRPAQSDERYSAYRIRVDAAYHQTLQQPLNNLSAEGNGDEATVPNYAASFTKLLDHDPTLGTASTAGQAAYEQLIKAMSTGQQSDFNAITFHSGTQRKYVNPQSGLAWTLIGGDSCSFSISPAPNLASATAAADMIEVYLNTICRDVQFKDYGTGLNSDSDGNGGSITNKAALILDDLSAYTGPKNNSNHVTAAVLFKGASPGDQVGPYVSQYFWQPTSPLYPAGCAGFVSTLIGVQNLPTIVLQTPQLYPIALQREFGVSWNDFVAIQNGLIPKQYAYTDFDPSNLRYMITGRDLGNYVHQDGPYEAYVNAINILASNNFPISPTSPYRDGNITKEAAGIDMGPPDAFSLIGRVALEGFKASWAQKWRTDRRLRPEAMAGLVHQAQTTSTNPYNLDSSLFTTHNGYNVLALVLAYNQRQSLQSVDPQQLLSFSAASTYLLSQMFPEGSPAHPSYPQGHGTVAGACITVIKAIFDDTALISSKITPVQPDPNNQANLIPYTGGDVSQMTVGSELDKLASNIALGRDFAGVHYRSDAIAAILLGEQVGIRCLQDHCRTYPEQGFTGYQLTKYDGTRIQITPDNVEVIS
jgi:hypothetical protein